MLDDQMLTNGFLLTDEARGTGRDPTAWGLVFQAITQVSDGSSASYRIMSSAIYGSVCAGLFLLVGISAASKWLAFVSVLLFTLSSAGPENFLTVAKLETSTSFLILLATLIVAAIASNNLAKLRRRLTLLFLLGIVWGLTAGHFAKELTVFVIPALSIVWVWTVAVAKKREKAQDLLSFLSGVVSGFAGWFLRRLLTGVASPLDGSYTNSLGWKTDPEAIRFAFNTYWWLAPDVILGLTVFTGLVLVLLLRARYRKAELLVVLLFALALAWLYFAALVVAWPLVLIYYLLPISMLYSLGVPLALGVLLQTRVRLDARRQDVATSFAILSGIPIVGVVLLGSLLTVARANVMASSSILGAQIVHTLSAHANKGTTIYTNLPDGNEMLENIPYFVSLERTDLESVQLISLDSSSARHNGAVPCGALYLEMLSSNPYAFGVRETAWPTMRLEEYSGSEKVPSNLELMEGGSATEVWSIPWIDSESVFGSLVPRPVQNTLSWSLYRSACGK